MYMCLLTERHIDIILLMSYKMQKNSSLKLYPKKTRANNRVRVSHRRRIRAFKGDLQLSWLKSCETVNNDFEHAYNLDIKYLFLNCHKMVWDLMLWTMSL